jgi:hypothetical protein
MALVNRDPFSRSELHKERVYNPPGKDGCDWCGTMPKTPKSNRPFLFRFWQESDGGRRSTIPGLFCSTACRAYFHA